MKVSELKNKILSGGFDNSYKTLYADVNEAKMRYSNACDDFIALFGDMENARLFSAPGRTEVGGNHTDHQHGRVLTGSVDMDVIAVAAKTNNNTVTIKSKGFPQDVVELNNLEKVEAETGHAISLIRGMCAAFNNAGYTLGGFTAYTTSKVLKGSGLSSSAAFEVLIGNILNEMFAGGSVSRIDIAKMAQKSESEYFGKPCGLLDQSASSIGGFTAIDFMDPENPKVEQINFDLAEHGFALCVVDTGGNHADLTQDYADITLECKQISNEFGKQFLREVNPADFYANMADLRKKYGERAVLRAFHFFNEDERAEAEKEALKCGNFNEFLRLVNLSGNSSFKYLQNVYSVSNVASQGLSLALALSEQFIGKIGNGACRVHGGGFAGTIQCYIPLEHLGSYKSTIENVFGEGSCHILKIRPIGGCEIK